MLKRFSGGWWLVLSFLTLGIYSLYVMCSMTSQHNKMALAIGGKKVMGFFPACLLGIVTLGIFPIVWAFMFYGQMSKLNRTRNADILPKRSFFMLIAGSIPFFGMFWLCDAHNSLVDVYATQKIYK